MLSCSELFSRLRTVFPRDKSPSFDTFLYMYTKENFTANMNTATSHFISHMPIIICLESEIEPYLSYSIFSPLNRECLPLDPVLSLCHLVTHLLNACHSRHFLNCPSRQLTIY